jgi:hypothetical protein
MFNKRFALSGVIALVILVVSGASAQAGSTSKQSDDVQRLTLIEHTVQENNIDVGAKGDSLGDYVVFTNDLRQNGKKVGTDSGQCTATGAVRATSVTVQCLVTVSLPKGDLTVQGLVTFSVAGPSKPNTVAITGGTRAYRTAHGQVTVTDLANGDTKLVLEIIGGHD